ncbi:GCN5-related N-acetyltransferase [Gloeothece citriformis PCC 7424]|uniref:GCN5-related N-acetyltransferase n=1 Tax=Gloeothece citriformis (strain PCC 7424) TaxID=65393 RepID=B7KE51_GLOC7|nr:N-acetyltransferase [Gloeothece citriformis]ACK71749.1 GCN5-related N-acetyltransferase [Gloeothece citriformis PCC 7424]
MFSIRPENQDDAQGVRFLLEKTFNRPQEANLVETLRARDMISLSLVAHIDEQIVGYIAFSPVELESNESSLKILGLAPLAILPQYQRQALGSNLVEIGLQQCQALGYEAIVVLGEPTFYHRFGFRPTSLYSLWSSFDIPSEFFMIKELITGSLGGHSGVILYQPEFNLV